MNWLRELLRRWKVRSQPSRFDQDLADEMQLHLELRAAEKQSAGLPPDDAYTAARRQFGNTTQLRESSREAYSWAPLDHLSQDIRYGLRTLRANPGFTATAVLSLALGIGANTAMFSILNAVLLRTIPIADPHALVQIRISDGDDELNTPLWEQIRDHQRAFSGVLAYASDRFDLANGGESRFAQGLFVSGDFFRVLGVPALIGRDITTADDHWGGGVTGNAAVISHSFWTRNYGGDPSVIGRTLTVNRNNFTIVGITPAWFTGLDVDHSFDVAVPIGAQGLLHPDRKREDEVYHWWLRILGRVPDGQTMQQSEDRLQSTGPEIFRAGMPPVRGAEDASERAKLRFHLRPAAFGFSATRTQYHTALYVLMTIVGLVLLIACANIANLLLARGVARQRELSVRMAIGASRSRIVRQLMTESTMISIAGAAVGLLFATWASRMLVRLLSTSRQSLEIDVSPDLRILAFTIGVALVTALLFGLVPALRATRVGVHPVLKESERGTLQGGTRFTLRKTLVAAQIALSLILLVGAGLFLGSLRNLLSVDLGFNRRNVVLVSVDAPLRSLPAAQRPELYHEILDRLRALPGVISAASMRVAPMGSAGWAQPTAPEGFTVRSPRDSMMFFNRVSPGYFQTLNTPILLGRDFNETDTLASPRVMLINESAAKQFFHSENPIGKTIALGRARPTLDTRETYQVIGVVKDTRYNRVNEPQRRIGYLAATQDAQSEYLHFAVRTDGPVQSMMPLLQSTISGANRELSLEFRDLSTQVDDTLALPRLVAMLSLVFGGLALLLAIVGLYGITAYAVTQRKAEIGIRMALGATGGSVVRLMLRDVVVLLVIGVALGLAASLAAGRLVTSLLYGVKPNDSAQLIGAALTLSIAAAIAAYIPARRAARLDPMKVLRDE